MFLRKAPGFFRLGSRNFLYPLPGGVSPSICAAVRSTENHVFLRAIYDFDNCLILQKESGRCRPDPVRDS